MTLPASGSISLTEIAAELVTPAQDLAIGSTPLRTLAGIQAGVISLNDFHGKTAVGSSQTAYVGISSVAVAVESTILSLPAVQVVALTYTFSLTAGAGKYMYFAWPKSRGFVTFFESQPPYWEGGWDGANNNTSIFGPKIVSVLGVDHYVYRSDWPNLGTVGWDAKIPV